MVIDGIIVFWIRVGIGEDGRVGLRIKLNVYKRLNKHKRRGMLFLCGGRCCLFTGRPVKDEKSILFDIKPKVKKTGTHPVTT
jgi:hypothetical protein